MRLHIDKDGVKLHDIKLTKLHFYFIFLQTFLPVMVRRGLPWDENTILVMLNLAVKQCSLLSVIHFQQKIHTDVFVQFVHT